jgi:hypothetical protein
VIRYSFLSRRLCLAGGRRRAWIMLTVGLVGLGLPQVFRGSSFALDATSIQRDDPTIDVSRDQWRERIAETKRRVRQFALEHKGQLTFEAPMDDQERIASERVLNDDSLQQGDIVSTNKGMFVFKGPSDQERRESDFIALPYR